jgi:hypothetical protein
MEFMDVVSGFLAITLPIVATILLSDRQTRRIIQTSNRQTQRIIQSSNRQTRRIIQTSNRQTQRIIQTSNRQTQRIIQTSSHQTQHILGKLERCLVKIGRTQRDIQRCLLKLDFGFKANAAMHGWARVDGVTPAQARKLPEPKVHDPDLRICYYKPD